MPSGQVKREKRRVKRKSVGKADGFESCPQDIPKLFTIHYYLFTDMEVGGVEPPSETASTKLLRVYPAFDLARGMPTGGLILKQPLGYTNFGARAESSEASPAELCRGGLAGVCRATSGP